MARVSPFYITLPSDASMHTFPQNNAAEWTTKLPHPISLCGKWEVGLAEFHYINSLYAVRKGIDTLEIFVIEYIHQLGDNEFSVKEKQFTVEVPPGTYKNGQALLDAINAEIPVLDETYFFYPKGEKITATQLFDKPHTENGKLIQLSLKNPAQETTTVALASMRVRVAFPKESRMKAMLGFEDDVTLAFRNTSDPNEVAQHIHTQLQKSSFEVRTPLPSQNLQITSTKACNPSLGTQELYVYSDIADYGIIGDSCAQILRAIPIKGEVNKLVENRFDFPHYVPLIKTYFENIHLIIADEVGVNAKFHSGKSLIKLHFRPQRPY